MKISQREMVLGAVTLACILLGGTWYGTQSKYAEWKNMKTQMEDAENDIARYKAAIEMQDSWFKELMGLQSRLRVFSIDQPSVAPQLMRTISTIADKHRLRILSSQPREEEKIGNLYELEVNCTWSGSIEAMVNFLTELQQQGLRYDINSLNISPAGNNSNDLRGNMVINCVYTRQAQAGG